MTRYPAGIGIVVGVDGSHTSKVALQWAARDAALRELPLVLVHVLPSESARTWLAVPFPEDHRETMTRRSHEILDEARDLVDRTTAGMIPVVVTESTECGAPTAALVAMSRDATMVVVGCRGVGKWGGRLLGSVSSALVHHAHCPVVICHDHGKDADPGSAPVVVGIDGSAASELAVDVAVDEAVLRGVELVVVHSWVETADELTELGPLERPLRSEHMIDTCLGNRQKRSPDLKIKKVLVRGDPARTLIETAESAQLLVVGSHGRGGFAGMVLGSVGAGVVQAAHIPVVVARRS
ncbi:universal stress protein TB31.7 [soil metagenome]